MFLKGYPLKATFRHLILFFLGCALILLAGSIASLTERSFDKVRQAEKFAEALNEKTDRTIRLIKGLQKDIARYGPRKTHSLQADRLRDLFRKEGILLFVFRNDELVLWSDNSLSAVTAWRTATLGTEIYHFENGWYRLVSFSDGIDDYVGAILISRTYPYKNEYLEEGFLKDFRQRNLLSIHLRAEEGSVKLKADHQTFYLKFSPDSKDAEREALIYILIAIGGGILALYSLMRLYQTAARRLKPYVAFPLMLIAILGLRYFSLKAGWPSIVTAIPLFDPTLYASSFLRPNFADYLINVVLLGLLSLYAWRSMKAARPGKGQWKYRAAFALGSLALFFFVAWINQMAKELVINSSIPFDVYNINNIRASSILGILSVGILYLSAFLIADGIAQFARIKALRFKPTVLIILLITAAWIVLTHSVGIRDLGFVLWPAILLLLTTYTRLYVGTTEIQLIDATLLIVLFAALGAYNFQKYTSVREHNQRRILAEKFAINDDPIAEVLFEELSEQLVKDQDVRQLFEQEELHSRETLEDYILSRYFTGYWSKYDITLHVFDRDKTVWGKLPATRPSTFDVLIDKLIDHGETSNIKQGLNFLYNAPDRTVYLAFVPLNYSLSNLPDGYFVFEFTSSLFPQQIGFPSLLIDREINRKLDEEYATARYIDQRLITERGDYPYPSNPKLFEKQLQAGNDFFSLRGFEHFVSMFGEGDLMVISKKLPSTLDNITMMTYLCIIYAFLLVMMKLAFDLRNRGGLVRPNLNRKIQLLLVTLAATIMVLFSLATRYYIENKYTEKNERLISEKMNSILLEMENKLGEEEQLNYDMADYLNRLLSQFSVIFFTDINLFDKSGNLIASSQMRMYNEGLVSRKMDPRAFVHLSYLDQMQFVQEEAVGELTYISAYSPLLNQNGELIGYANLPYFARQTELTNEISSFLVSVINLFVLVFVLSLILALFISQWITLPLRSIRESLAAIELGKSNRLVGYEGKDEIGRLVDEYNAKVTELEINAEKLSQSERESAWREMAKQVAHEIKNPLTPMKLSVQHLERSMLKGETPEPDMVRRIVKNLVEQIDTLSSIASAFSGFAKMPKAKVERVDIVEAAKSTLELFSGFERIDFELDANLGAESTVMADRDQLIRVFNNLLKNAVQSIPDDRKGKISLFISDHSDEFIIRVVDNGAGISEEQKSKIFVPNFTTKSRGMGLGLAISKNIIENFGGSITFSSRIGIGSTFTVRLPKA